MSEPAWIIRTHRKTDAKRLGAFECATANVKWQLEVERFVRNKLHDWTTAPLGKTHSDARTILLVCRASRELVGVAAHERVRLSSPLSGEFDGTKIEVVAISTAWQGKRFSSGERASDVLMSAVMFDIENRLPPRSKRVLAVVHKDNGRSIALCQRHGLARALSNPDPDYLRLIT